MRFISKLETGYKSRDDVPFHNRSHAADVVQGTAYFLNQAAHQIGELQPLDVFSLILSAAMHDHNHPGVTNAFMVNSKDELAILYNDASVLEMHHLASSWRLLLDNAANPFEGFSPEQYNEARQTIIHVILGTDMKYHFDHLTKFKTRIGSDCEWSDRKDVRLILAMCLHSADVGNPAKPWKLSCEWSARVMDEFFRQGDTEASRGMAVSPFMDREKTDIAKCQVGFIKCVPRHPPAFPAPPHLPSMAPLSLSRAPAIALASSLSRPPLSQHLDKAVLRGVGHLPEGRRDAVDRQHHTQHW